MTNYKDWYNHYEDTALHVGVPEVKAAENRLSDILKTITDLDIRFDVDIAAGQLARAYEMQGFSLGNDAARQNGLCIA